MQYILVLHISFLFCLPLSLHICLSPFPYWFVSLNNTPKVQKHNHIRHIAIWQNALHLTKCVNCYQFDKMLYIWQNAWIELRGGWRASSLKFPLCSYLTSSLQVVLTSTKPSELCINGMSFSRRASKWANSALVVTVSAKDFDSLNLHGPLAGVHFQVVLGFNYQGF